MSVPMFLRNLVISWSSSGPMERLTLKIWLKSKETIVMMSQSQGSKHHTWTILS